MKTYKTRITLSMCEVRELKKCIIHYDMDRGETKFRDNLYNKLFDAEERIRKESEYEN